MLQLRSRNQLRGLCCLAFAVGLCAEVHAAGVCQVAETPPMCSDSVDRNVGDILIAVQFETDFDQPASVGILGVPPGGTEQDVYLHARWTASSVGDLHPVGSNPKQQWALTSPTYSRLYHLDECGRVITDDYGRLQPGAQEVGFAVDPVSGDVLVSGSLSSASVPHTHTYYRVAAPSSHTTFISELRVVDGLPDYEGANSAQSGAMAFTPDGTLFQSGYGRESLTSISAEQLSRTDGPVEEILSRIGLSDGAGLEELVHDGSHLWAIAIPSVGKPSGAVVRINPTDKQRTDWYIPDGPADRLEGLVIDRDGNLWVSTRGGRLTQLSRTTSHQVTKTIDLVAAVSHLSSKLPSDVKALTSTRSLSVYGANPPAMCPISSACSVANLGRAGSSNPSLVGLGMGLGLALMSVVRRRRR